MPASAGDLKLVSGAKIWHFRNFFWAKSWQEGEKRKHFNNFLDRYRICRGDYLCGEEEGAASRRCWPIMVRFRDHHPPRLAWCGRIIDICPCLANCRLLITTNTLGRECQCEYYRYQFDSAIEYYYSLQAKRHLGDSPYS